MFKNKFKTRPLAETITAGECLRRRREALDLDLAQISKKIGVRQDYLESLEKGDYQPLPPQVYVRGFIKSYAAHLGIDPQPIIRIYNHEASYLSEDEQESRQSERGKKAVWKDRLSVTPHLLAWTGSLCVVLVLGYYFMHQINSFNSKPYLFIESPVADEVVKEKELWISGRTEADAILEINGQEISVDKAGAFSQKITLSAGRNLLVVEAKNRFDRTDRREINIIYEAPPEEKILVKELSEEEPVPAGEVEFIEEDPVDTPVNDNLGSVLGANAAQAESLEAQPEKETEDEAQQTRGLEEEPEGNRL